MLINLYGSWLNADNITYILDGSSRANVYFTHGMLEIRNKTAEEVGKELNRQLVMAGQDALHRSYAADGQHVVVTKCGNDTLVSIDKPVKKKGK